MSKPELPPGPKIAAQMSPEASPEEMQWVKQMGVDYVVLWTDESKSTTQRLVGQPVLPSRQHCAECDTQRCTAT